MNIYKLNPVEEVLSKGNEVILHGKAFVCSPEETYTRL